MDTIVLSERIEEEFKVLQESSKPINDRIKRKRTSSKTSTPNKKAKVDTTPADKVSEVESPKDKLRSSPHRAVLPSFNITDEVKELRAKWMKEAKEEEDVPRNSITVSEKWLGKMVDGNTTVLEEEYVRKTFGDIFTDELKQVKRGFVDIPVGDYKPS